MKKQSAYSVAGVDIDSYMTALQAVKRQVKSTRTPGCAGALGSFSGMFAAPGKDKVLLASTDGVGTKLQVATMAGRHSTIGQDLVNHCVNDLLVLGAKPLFFLDYFGTSHLESHIFKSVLAGLCKACRQNHCALIGGETAEMPGLYPKGEYELVGTIVGVANRKHIITGESICPNDVLIGLPSSGLHTNGYSLARRVIFKQAKLGINDQFPGTRRSVADILLAVHKSYLRQVQILMKRIQNRGMAHNTGGGFFDNISRILPATVDAVVDSSAWHVPAAFKFIQREGKIDKAEMYRVFNMGIGIVIIVRSTARQKALKILQQAKAKPKEIGWIEKGSGKVHITG